MPGGAAAARGLPAAGRAGVPSTRDTAASEPLWARTTLPLACFVGHESEAG